MDPEAAEQELSSDPASQASSVVLQQLTGQAFSAQRQESCL